MVKKFKCSNVVINAYLPEKQMKKIVVGVHGFAGDSKSSVLQCLGDSLCEKGVGLLTFDLPCHGENASENDILSLSSCLKTLSLVVKFAQKNFNVPINFFGTSFGAYLLLLYFAKEGKPQGEVVLRAPAIFMSEVFENILSEHGFSLFDLHNGTLNLGYENNLFVDYAFYEDLSSNKLSNFDFDFAVDVIQGKMDNVVDWKKNEEFFLNKFANRCKIYYLSKADHRFKNSGELEKIIEIAKSVFCV